MAEEPAFPWKEGDLLAPGWTIENIQRHAEFVLLTVASGDKRTQVEVTFHDGPPAPWATRRYRVQPAQGTKPPRALLIATHTALAAFDDATPGEPFVRRVSVDPNAGAAPPPGAESDDPNEAKRAAEARAALEALDRDE